MKKTVSLVLTVCLLSMACICAFATETIPYADSVFTSATATLSAQKGVTFTIRTSDEQNSIKVTACWLQEKNGSTWRYVKSLSVPSKNGTDTTVYNAYMDYSSSIGSGTYRIGFIANADGHTITRYSNERTY